MLGEGEDKTKGDTGRTDRWQLRGHRLERPTVRSHPVVRSRYAIKADRKEVYGALESLQTPLIE